MNAIFDDVRFAYRALGARAGFVIAVVLTFALGVGAACTLPAWRAPRISPVAALRHE